MKDIKKEAYENLLKMKKDLESLRQKMQKFERMFNELLNKKQEGDPDNLLKDL